MVVKIEGMMCNHCVNRVIKGLTDVGATDIVVSLEKGEASFKGLTEEKAREVVEDLGFNVKSVN